ncbi:DUF2690 domain-containing protein [Nonomuraea sp. NPDC050404]|uniref:DUF2690 domain-containing protein n=1 Tax=Nonomuraea sp. NPDC050404 TaxID=3155783 RepID=UPI00340D6A6A
MYRALAAVTMAAGLLLTATTAYAQTDPGPSRGPGQDIGSAAKGTKRACTGKRCNGLDPVVQGCAGDARTTYWLSTRSGLLERRYSRSCDASWARITGSSPGTGFYVQTCRSNYVSTFQVPRGYDNAYTDMVPGAWNVRVGNVDDHGPC